MIAALLEFSLRQRILILGLTCFCAAAGRSVAAAVARKVRRSGEIGLGFMAAPETKGYGPEQYVRFRPRTQSGALLL